MKIVVLDGYTENPGDLSWEPLAALGDLTVYDRTSLTNPHEAIARIADAEVVFTNKTPITKAVMDACPNIRFISVLATRQVCAARQLLLYRIRGNRGHRLCRLHHHRKSHRRRA